MAFIAKCLLQQRIFRSTINWTEKSRLLSTSTTPRSAPAAGAAAVHAHEAQAWISSKGQWLPVAVVFGLIGASASMALHTAIQQLGRSPDVKVRKKKRETMPEVYDPDAIAGSSDRCANKSFFRKVAKIQDPRRNSSGKIPDPYTRSREVESLKSIGILD